MQFKSYQKFPYSRLPRATDASITSAICASIAYANGPETEGDKSLKH